MTYEQIFMVEGQYLGRAVREEVIVHAQLQVPYSYAYFCPVCAEVWARCPVQLPQESPNLYATFQVWELPCYRHKMSYFQVPGALTLPWDKPFTESFPPEVLNWELHRHMDFYEEQHGTDT